MFSMRFFIFLLILLPSTCFTQIITTIAGTGVGSYTGDGGPAINATFSEPQCVMLDDTGNVYVVDEDDNVIRKINPAGIINTIIGSGMTGYSGDGGPARIAKINHPGGCAIDRKGNIFIADSYNHVIRKVNTAGIISTVAGHGTISGYGGDGGPATVAYLNFPEMVAIDKKNNLYITDAGNNRVRKIDTSGIITTIAGTGLGAYAGDGGPADSAKLKYPTGIVVDTSTGIIYIGDANNNAVRKIDAAGIITTFAGTGVMGYSGNGGPATAAKLNNPQGVTIDTAGTVYISDGGNNEIRKVNTAGIISAYAGAGVAGFSGDGGPAFLAKIYNPPEITVDVTGNLYIAEYFNSRVRKVSFCAVPLNMNIGGAFTVCPSDSTTLIASGASNYTWSVNAGAALTASVSVKPAVSSTYSVIGESGQCAAADSVTVNIISCSAGIAGQVGINFTMYPNPATNVVTVQTGFIPDTQVEIYNSLGEKVFSDIIKNKETTININSLSEGMYLVRFLKNNSLFYQNTLVKQ